MRHIKEGQDSMAGVGMGNYVVDEGPELTSTVRAVTNDISEPVLQLYTTLKNMAKQFQASKGDLKGFQMIAAGASQRWYDNFYFNRLGKELHHLAQQSPRVASELRAFLSTLPKNFAEVSAKLPEILLQIGQKSNDRELARKAQVWINARTDYKRYLIELETGSDDDENDELVVKSPKNPALGQQAGQADSIVNDILRKLSGKVAGDIRNAIARAPNKLQALQTELQKRGIKVPMNESILDEIEFAHELGSLNKTDSDIIASAKPDGKIGQRTVMLYINGATKLYFFANNKIEAVLLLTGNTLNAIKNFTQNKGLIYALINYVINIKQQKLIINPSDPLTPFGIDWVISQINRSDGFKITDLTGEKIDVNKLKQEWNMSKNDDNKLPGLTGIIIGESSRGAYLRENESNLMPYDIFGVNLPMNETIAKNKDSKQIPINESAEIAIRVLINQLAKK